MIKTSYKELILDFNAPITVSFSNPKLSWLTLIGLLMVSATALGGCVENQPGFPRSAPSGSGPAQAPEKKEAETPKKPKLEIETLKPNVSRAKQRLSSNFEHFLKREPIGFDTELYRVVLQDATEQLSSFRSRLQESPVQTTIRAATYALTLLALWLFFLLVAKPIWQWCDRKQAQLHLSFTGIGTQFLRSCLLVLGRILPVFIIIGLSYFPIQAIYEQSSWTTSLTNGLWAFLLYRLSHSSALLVLSARLESSHPQTFRDAKGFFTLVFRSSLLLGLLLISIKAFGYHQELYDFGIFCLKLVATAASVYLLTRRELILELFPEKTDSRLYTFAREQIERYYYWLFTITTVLMAFWLAGFENATAYILVRGYSIIVLLLTATYLAGVFRRSIERQLDGKETVSADQIDHGSEGESQLLRSIEKLVLVAGGIALVIGVLELLNIYNPLVILLASPLVEVGVVEVSLLDIVKVGLIGFGTLLAVKILKAVLNTKVYPAYSVDVGTGYAINTLLNYALFVVGFFVALGALGVNLSTLTVVMASLGVGIGFGLQTLTENLISGFIILFGRSVEKGDIITVDDTYGRIEAVGARSVVIRTPDNVDMLIPSKAIVGGQIINWTYQDSQIRLHVPVGVSYKADPSAVKEVLLSVAREHDKVLDNPEPDVWLVSFGDSSVNFELLVYFDVKDVPPARLKGQMYYDIWAGLHDADIEIPFPQRDLHIKSAIQRQHTSDMASTQPGTTPRSNLGPEETEDSAN